MGKELKLSKHEADRLANTMQEQFDGDVSVSIHVKKKIPKTSAFIMFYQAVNFELVKVLSPAGCKVLLYLMSKTTYDNYVGINQKTIMEELEYKAPKSVNDAIKELIKYNIIISMPDLADKRRNVYFINPYQSWKGKVSNRVKAISKANDIDFNQMKLPFIEFDKFTPS